MALMRAFTFTLVLVDYRYIRTYILFLNVLFSQTYFERNLKRDPQNAVDFVQALYGDGAFLNSLYNSLTENGVLLTQVGESAYIGDIAETYPGNINYQRFMYEKAMKNQGFEAVMHYEESRAGFNGIWSFYAAFKDGSSRARWEMNDAQIDLEIRKRSIPMVDGRDLEEGEMKGPFEVFDGPTMATYRFPSKHSQVMYCLRDPQPYGCATNIKDHYNLNKAYYEPSGFDPEIPNFSSDNFALGGGGGRGLIPRVTIPEKSYLMLEQSIHDVSITPSTSSILDGAFTSGDKDNIFGRTIDSVTRFVSGTPEGLTIPRRVRTIIIIFGQDLCRQTFGSVVTASMMWNSHYLSCGFIFFNFIIYSEKHPFHIPNRYWFAFFPIARMRRNF